MIVNNKIGITLSGGGFRGIAHLGVLQYMEELGISFDAISGASAGALIGAFIAEGYTPVEIFKFAKTENFFNYSDLFQGSGGLFSPDIFERIITKYIPHDSFEQLKVPLYVSVTDLSNARSLVFNQGSLSFAIKSSCCFPMVFIPVNYYNDTILCDGGILNNFPSEHINATCGKSVGVDVNSIELTKGPLGYGEIVDRILRIITSKIDKDGANYCDVFIQPGELRKFSTFDTKHMDEIYQIGYEHAKKFQNDLLSLMEHNNRSMP
ncbi:MAG: patatin-like phospholipase family protein [Bacteroidota bacterium]